MGVAWKGPRAASERAQLSALKKRPSLSRPLLFPPSPLASNLARGPSRRPGPTWRKVRGGEADEGGGGSGWRACPRQAPRHARAGLAGPLLRTLQGRGERRTHIYIYKGNGEDGWVCLSSSPFSRGCCVLLARARGGVTSGRSCGNNGNNLRRQRWLSPWRGVSRRGGGLRLLPLHGGG